MCVSSDLEYLKVFPFDWVAKVVFSYAYAMYCMKIYRSIE